MEMNPELLYATMLFGAGIVVTITAAMAVLLEILNDEGPQRE